MINFKNIKVIIEKSVKTLTEISNMTKRAFEEIPEIIPPKTVKDESAVRMKRRRYALLMMYSGSGFYGMVRQPNFPTIEEHLLKSLLTCEAITQYNYERPGQVKFQRASKTDKNVSALGQVVSIKLNEDIDIKSSVNKLLPDTIRILDCIRVTQNFNAKDACCHRVYEYIMPSFALSPKETPLNETDLWKFRVNEEIRNKFTEALKTYIGTRCYFNFTSGRDPSDRSLGRYIMNMECSEPLELDDKEFIIVTVTGQSFMLHQIRKMIGLAIAIVRGHTTSDIFDIVFKTERIDIPKAPGLGLLLNRVVYDHYNERYGSDHETIDWDKYSEEIKQFRNKYVIDFIAQQELSEKSMLIWLETLDLHTYSSREQVRNPPRTVVDKD